MNMKKIMAGIAASALAVTSLATVASAAAEGDGVIATLAVTNNPKLDYYNVTVDVGGNLRATDKTQPGSVTVNLLPDVKDNYYYFDRSGLNKGLLAFDIKLTFVYNQKEWEIPYFYTAGDTGATWTLDINGADSDGNNTVSNAELKKYLDDNVTAKKSLIPVDITLNQVYVEFKARLYSIKFRTGTNDPYFDELQQFEQAEVIEKYDINSYEVLDDIYSNDHLGMYLNGVTFSNSTTNEETTSDVPLSQARKPYTAGIKYTDDAGKVPTTIYFLSEDVALAALQGLAFGGKDPSTDGVNVIRFTKDRSHDLYNLDPESKINISIKLNGAASGATEIYYLTDLMNWRGESAITIPVAKGASEVTHQVPLNTVYDKNYKLNYTSGLLAYAQFTQKTSDGVLFVSGNDVKNRNLTEISLTYNKDDVQDDAASDNTPAVDNTPKPVGAKVTIGTEWIKYTTTWDVLYAGGAQYFDFETDLTDNGITYLLSLTDDAGKSYQPDGEVKFSVSIPEKFQGQTLKEVNHVFNDGTKEALTVENADTVATDKFVTVTLDHFSGIELVFGDDGEDTSTEAPETEAPETEAPETEAPATEAPETEAPATEAPVTEAPAASNNGNTNPGTGVVLVAIPAIVAAAGVVISKKRK